MARLFVALVEVRRRPGCQLLAEGVHGARLRCYFTARGPVDALQRLGDELGALFLGVSKLDWCLPLDAMEGGLPLDDDETRDFVDHAKDTGDFVVGRADSW